MSEDPDEQMSAVERSQDMGRLVSADVVELRERLEHVLDALTDEQVAAPSRLPGWTRGHVLAHLVGVGDAQARQIEYARAGRSVPLFDGGTAGRDAQTEARAGGPAQVLARDVLTAALRMEAALGSLGAADWDVLTSYREGPVLGCAEAWRRELAIHVTDLDLGIGPEVWSQPFQEHLVQFLAPRVPPSVLLVLVPGEGASRWEIGDGQPVRVHGRGVDLLTWLAGREPFGPVTAESDGDAVALPALGPWPSAAR